MSAVNRYLDPALVERLNHLSLTARRVVEGTAAGLYRSRLKGASIEFRQHRAYARGDEIRRLDWRILARTDRPFVKEYDEEVNLRCLMLLDSSGSMDFGDGSLNKFDYACRLTASLAYLMLGQSEAVGLTTMGQKIRQWIPPHVGTRQMSQLIDAMEHEEPRDKSSLADCAKEMAERVRRRSFMLIISDFFEPIDAIRTALSRLWYSRHEVVCLRILHPQELEFPFTGWMRLRGKENDRPRLIESAVARERYQANFREHSTQMQRMCASIGMTFYEFVTDRPLADELTRFLRARSLS